MIDDLRHAVPDDKPRLIDLRDFPICPRCGKRGFQSIYMNSCTACANAAEFGHDDPAPGKPLPVVTLSRHVASPDLKAYRAPHLQPGQFVLGFAAGIIVLAVLMAILEHT